MGQMRKKYKVVIAQSGKLDVENKRRYIIETFKYRSYAEDFSQKIKKALQQLDLEYYRTEWIGST